MLSASLTPANRHYELVKLVNNLLDSGLPPTFLDFSDRLLERVCYGRVRNNAGRYSWRKLAASAK